MLAAAAAVAAVVCAWQREAASQAEPAPAGPLRPAGAVALIKGVWQLPYKQTSRFAKLCSRC